MNIIIVGGGKVGYYLCKDLLPLKHNIYLIEEDEETCRKIANELDVSVLNGDGTDVSFLNEAECEIADVFIAVTGKDEDNLISCQLAKKYFNVPKTISRVNNPKNIQVFEQLGVDKAVSSTSEISDLIGREIDHKGMKTLLKLNKGKVAISELEILPKTFVCNKALKEIKMPKECVIITIIRDENVIIPNGNTVIRESDIVLTLAGIEDREELNKFLLRESKN